MSRRIFSRPLPNAACQQDHTSLGMTSRGAGDDFYRVNGAGEMLVYSWKGGDTIATKQVNVSASGISFNSSSEPEVQLSLEPVEYPRRTAGRKFMYHLGIGRRLDLLRPLKRLEDGGF
jgi:hypothetical protein